MDRRTEQVGVVIHPRRDIDAALATTRAWADTHGVVLGQVLIPGQNRRVAEPVAVESCDLVLALGGDGTALAALHAAAPTSRPVLGVACGSLGVLTSVAAGDLSTALDQVTAANWSPRPLPALEITNLPAGARFAINDFAMIRDGTGQVITEIRVGDELYAQTAGDGLVVATPLGSSAYTMAAGGPILAPGAQGIVITPLAQHGGVSPPLVAGPDSRVRVIVEPGYGGSRFEIDGQETGMAAHEVTVTLRRDYASLVSLAAQEPLLTGLRRRGLVVDSPRILARDARERPS
ncbi:MAG TPA: NAD(+)/NADH kinase [Thermoleophilaceae bacterium]|nr:NAD(+)/NADH kinase [Thermoleophilaceae bacterium]